MATKIRLKRLGKIRSPHYRIVVMDSRAKRDGRAIEEIGLYHPKNDPSVIEVDSERAQYWLGVGAQPTEAVVTIFKRSGDWQKFTGEKSESGIEPQAEKVDKAARFNAALAEADSEPADVRDQPGQEEGRRRRGWGRDRRRGLIVLGEALEHLVRGLVSNPDEVRVSDSDRRRPRTLEVRVHPEDIGKVIGRQGRTASALRTVVAALADRETVRVDFVDVDRRNQRRRP